MNDDVYQQRAMMEAFKDKVFTNVEVDMHNTTVTFTRADGEVYQLHHVSDCCATMEIKDIVGDINDLIGTVIMDVEVVTDSTNPRDIAYVESFTWTFYKFRTWKGNVDMSWLGESNGYYSEAVTFTHIGEE